MIRGQENPVIIRGVGLAFEYLRSLVASEELVDRQSVRVVGDSEMAERMVEEVRVDGEISTEE